MDMRQLRYFLAVANEGQVTGAAKTLNMEQPPLSRQLKLLEQELGVSLFDRSGKRLKLTSAGELLRQRAEALLSQFNETIQEVKELDEGIRGLLSIGSVVSCVSLLPDRVRDFHKRFPQVTFKIHEGDHHLLGEELEQRRIELVVTRLPFETNADSSRYAIRRLPSDPFVAIVPRKWGPPGPSGMMSMAELAALPFLTLKTDYTTAMHQKVLNEFRANDLQPHILCECSSVAIILALVAAGIGATILPKSVIGSLQLDSIGVHAIPNTELQSDVGIVWVKDRYLSRGARRFIESFGVSAD